MSAIPWIGLGLVLGGFLVVGLCVWYDVHYGHVDNYEAAGWGFLALLLAIVGVLILVGYALYRWLAS